MQWLAIGLVGEQMGWNSQIGKVKTFTRGEFKMVAMKVPLRKGSWKMQVKQGNKIYETDVGKEEDIKLLVYEGFWRFV